MPIYLRHFNMATYGAWLASGNIIAMIALIEPGISTVATQKLAASYGIDDRERFADIFGSSLLLTFGFGLFVILLGLSLSQYIPSWLDVPGDQRKSLTLGLCFSSIGAGTSFVFYVLGAVPQALHRTVAPGFIGLFALSANIAAILAGLFAGMGVAALGLGSVALSITYILGYLVQIALVWNRSGFPRPTASIAVMREIWHDARMLLLAKIAGAIGKYLEAPAAALAVSTEAAAVLVLTGRVLNAVQMFADRVGTAVFAGMSHSFARYRENQDYAVLREVIVVSTIISGLGIGISLALSKSAITLWVGGRAFGGVPLLLLLALASFMSSRKDLISSLLVAGGQIRPASAWLAAEAMIRVLLIALLVVVFKVPGIPLATALASLFIVIALGRVLHTLPGLPREMLYVPGTKGCAISLILGLAYMQFAPGIATWTQLTIHGLLIGLTMFAANLLDREWTSVLRRTGCATCNAVVFKKGAV